EPHGPEQERRAGFGFGTLVLLVVVGAVIAIVIGKATGGRKGVDARPGDQAASPVTVPPSGVTAGQDQGACTREMQAFAERVCACTNRACADSLSRTLSSSTPSCSQEDLKNVFEGGENAKRTHLMTPAQIGAWRKAGPITYFYAAVDKCIANLGA